MHATPVANLRKRFYPLRILLAVCGLCAAALLLAMLLAFAAGAVVGALLIPSAPLPLLAATVCCTGAALLVCAPAGILASFLLHTACAHRPVRAVRWLLLLACGVPGVVWALAAAALLPRARSVGPCILALLCCLMLPRIILSCTGALARVPEEITCAARALGAGAVGACATACFACAWRDIAGGLLRAAIRGMGEAAGIALILRRTFVGTAGDTLASGILSALWHGDTPSALAAALVLVFFTALLSIAPLAFSRSRKVQRHEQTLP